jgi:hypothetical protein
MRRILSHRLGHVDASTASVDGIWFLQFYIVRSDVAGEIRVSVPRLVP